LRGEGGGEGRAAQEDKLRPTQRNLAPVSS